MLIRRRIDPLLDGTDSDGPFECLVLLAVTRMGAQVVAKQHVRLLVLAARPPDVHMHVPVRVREQPMVGLKNSQGKQNGPETEPPMGEHDAIAGGERVRQLGFQEMVFDELEQFAGGHLVRVIDFEGPIDPAIMETALRQLVRKRPLLGTRIVRDEDSRRWFVRDEREPPLFRVVDRHGPHDWVREFNRELNTQLGTNGMVPIRLCVVASDRPGGELVMSCAHAFCDGRSLFVFGRDLLREYEALRRGERGAADVRPSAISPEIADLLPDWLTPSRRTEVTEASVSHHLALPPPVVFPSHREESTEPNRSRVATLEVAADQARALRELARRQGTTMLGVLGAALVLAVGDLLAPSDNDMIWLATTVDLRTRLREPVPVENMGVFAGQVIPTFRGLRKRPMWAVAADMTAQTASAHGPARRPSGHTARQSVHGILRRRQSLQHGGARQPRCY